MSKSTSKSSTPPHFLKRARHELPQMFTPPTEEILDEWENTTPEDQSFTLAKLMAHQLEAQGKLSRQMSMIIKQNNILIKLNSDQLGSQDELADSLEDFFSEMRRELGLEGDGEADIEDESDEGSEALQVEMTPEDGEEDDEEDHEDPQRETFSRLIVTEAQDDEPEESDQDLDDDEDDEEETDDDEDAEENQVLVPDLIIPA